jgi:hypothetical protein
MLKHRFSKPPKPCAEPLQSPQGDWHDFPHGTVSLEAAVRAETAPNPYPSATSFAGVGRDSEHDGTRFERVTVLAFSEWLGVQGWPFAEIPRLLGSMVIPQSDRVRHVPIGFSPEIQMPSPVGVSAVAQALPTSDIQTRFIISSDPFAKLKR